MNTYKVCIIGNGNVGKTSYVKHLLGEDVKLNYRPTMGLEVHPISWNGLRLNIWDCAGDERFHGLGDGYYIQANAFLIFATKYSLTSIGKWIIDAKRVAPKAHIVIVISKCDEDSFVDMEKLKKEYNYPIFCISTKEKKNLDLPMLELENFLMRNPTTTSL